MKGPGVVSAADPYERVERVRRALDVRGLLHIVTAAALLHGVAPDDILSARRHPPVPAARHDVWARLRSIGFSYPYIGGLFEVDHSTVIDGVRRANGDQPRRRPHARRIA